jgi:hypothetical protein
MDSASRVVLAAAAGEAKGTPIAAVTRPAIAKLKYFTGGP